MQTKKRVYILRLPKFFFRKNTDEVYVDSIVEIFVKAGFDPVIYHNYLYDLKFLILYVCLRVKSKLLPNINRNLEINNLRLRRDKGVAGKVTYSNFFICDSGAVNICEAEFYPNSAVYALMGVDNWNLSKMRFIVRSELSYGLALKFVFKECYVEKLDFYLSYLNKSYFSKFIPLEKRRYDIIFVGNQARRKGYDYFLSLISRIDGLNVCVISNFSDFNYPKLSNVTYFSNISFGEVLSKFSESKILLFPTKNDSHPRVISEALCSGCFVLTSSIDSVVSLYGSLVDFLTWNEDKDILKIKELLKLSIDKDRTNKIVNRFSSDVTSTRYSEVFSKWI